MRLLPCFAIAAVVLCPVASAQKKLPVAEASNNRIAITATLYQGKDAVRELLGSDLGGHFFAVKVDLEPKTPDGIAVSLDDFLVRSSRDGQRCDPFAPSQIAGKGALVISSTGRGGAVLSEDRGGPVWGGIPGTGGRPQRIPGNAPTLGTATAGEATQATPDTSKKEDPLLAVLEEKVLAEDKKLTQPASGLLYFSLEGKHRPKDLRLHYQGAAGKLVLQFR